MWATPLLVIHFELFLIARVNFASKFWLCKMRRVCLIITAIYQLTVLLYATKIIEDTSAVRESFLAENKRGDYSCEWGFAASVLPFALVIVLFLINIMSSLCDQGFMCVSVCTFVLLYIMKQKNDRKIGAAQQTFFHFTLIPFYTNPCALLHVSTNDFPSTHSFSSSAPVYLKCRDVSNVALKWALCWRGKYQSSPGNHVKHGGTASPPPTELGLGKSQSASASPEASNG